MAVIIFPDEAQRLADPVIMGIYRRAPGAEAWVDKKVSELRRQGWKIADYMIGSDGRGREYAHIEAYKPQPRIVMGRVRP